MLNRIATITCAWCGNPEADVGRDKGKKLYVVCDCGQHFLRTHTGQRIIRQRMVEIGETEPVPAPKPKAPAKEKPQAAPSPATGPAAPPPEPAPAPKPKAKPKPPEPTAEPEEKPDRSTLLG